MKAMILVLSPKECVNLLNGDLSILARKKFPKDYVGWVYVYCLNDAIKNGWCMISFRKSQKHYHQSFSKDACYSPLDEYIGNGKVVARFWCDKVEEILSKENGNFYTNFLSNRKLLTQSCLAQNELRDYTAGNWKQKFCSYWYGGYAIHITKVELFDKSKELKEFHKVGYNFALMKALNIMNKSLRKDRVEEVQYEYRLTRAPSTYCYVEI